MKRVLQINSVCNWGSTGRIAEGIGRVALENNWESYIASGRYSRQSQSTQIKIGTKWDVIRHGIYTRLFDLHGFASKNATNELIKTITEIRPDIIHLHNLHGYYLNIKVLFDFLKEAAIPVVWTLHDCWPITGHCVYFDFINCEKWKTGCHNCPQKSSYPGSLMFDNSMKNYLVKKELFRSVEKMTIVSVSHWLSKILEQSFLNIYDIKVIHNGIDLNVFSPQSDDFLIRNKYSIGDRFMFLGIASTWSERKGLKDFIKLSQVLPDDAVLILVGLSKGQIKRMPSNIIGLESTEDILELTRLYSASDLYINTTWEDNFPTTNIEALACGTPVVTYRSGGSIEAVSPETGFIVEKGDIRGLLHVIELLKGTKKKAYSEACRKRAFKYFNNQNCFQKYIELFDSLLTSY